MGLPEERPDGLDSPVTAKVIKYMAKAQVAAFKATNGRVGNKWRIGAGWNKPVPTLLLEHVGRKSGKTFVTPLLYMQDGADIVVVASQGGLPKNPQWYANLAAHPDTRISLKGEKNRPVRARTATPDERERLWPRLVDVYADFAKYDAWTERTIPVVVLEPR
jgi:deazaflavin-dependent oxidoreductase (nitroreductase family)